jgi:hypothetical protein
MSYVGNTPTQQAFTPAIDFFSGNGSTVAFTLSRPVASVAQVQVTINNVAQNPSDAFTVSGSTITFTGAPSIGTNNIYVQYTSPITQVMQPGQGTVGTLQIADNAITTAKILNANVTPAKLSQPFTSGTAVASTSGTSIDFTSIPSWVKRVTVMFSGVSTSGSSFWLLRVGTGGTPETTGYDSTGNNVQTTNTLTTSTAGFVAYSNVSSYVVSGAMVLTNVSGNIWVCSGLMGTSTGASVQFTTTGTKTLAGVLNMVRVTTVNGTDTFDAGSINILME